MGRRRQAPSEAPPLGWGRPEVWGQAASSEGDLVVLLRGPARGCPCNNQHAPPPAEAHRIPDLSQNRAEKQIPAAERNEELLSADNWRMWGPPAAERSFHSRETCLHRGAT